MLTVGFILCRVAALRAELPGNLPKERVSAVARRCQMRRSAGNGLTPRCYPIFWKQFVLGLTLNLWPQRPVRSPQLIHPNVSGLRVLLPTICVRMRGTRTSRRQRDDDSTPASRTVQPATAKITSAK